MALPSYNLPYGLRQVKLTPLAADGTATVASSVLLPAARTFSFTDQETFNDLLGDDVTIASHGGGPTVAWDLESGGLSFEAYIIISGGVISTAGTTPAIKKTLAKSNTTARPYFQVEGVSINDNAGDIHGIVYRCKATGDIQGDRGNGEFMLTQAKGVGYGNLSDGKLYDWVENETPVPMTAGS